MHHVLRFMHPETKLGPFVHLKPGDLQEELGLEYFEDRPWQMPGITNDLLIQHEFDFQCGRHVCGVEYFSHLYEWFGTNLQPLFEAGFKLYLFLVPKEKILFTESGWQVAFDMADAVSVEEVL
jgi:hypothetical protein